MLSGLRVGWLRRKVRSDDQAAQLAAVQGLRRISGERASAVLLSMR